MDWRLVVKDSNVTISESEVRAAERGARSAGLCSLVAAVLVGGLFHSGSAFGSCPTPSFVTAGRYSAGSQPIAVAVADLNGDGLLDLVVANQFSANVSVLLGHGDGTFHSLTNYPAGMGPASVVISDFNSDGRVDLAVSDISSANISVLLGRGDGTFQAPTNSALTGSSQFAAPGDFDGDHHLDLAVAIRTLGVVSVVLGRGDGTFETATDYDVGSDPLAIALGDFNRDAALDLVVANANLFGDAGSSLSVLLGRGDGGFRMAVNYDAGISPRAVATNDFNGDGLLDLVVASHGEFVGNQFTNGSVAVLLGNGDGTFRSPIDMTAGEGPVAVVAADLNGDGRADLAVVNIRSQNLSTLFGNGDGTFTPASNFRLGMSPRSVAVGDFNGDGQPDLAVAGESGVQVLTNACLTANLSITKTHTPEPVWVGQTLTYTLTVADGGPDTAVESILTDRLPAGVRFDSVATSHGSCVNNGGTINCLLGSITNATHATVTINVTVTAAGPLTNTATASSPAMDPNMANNTASVVATALPVVSIMATDPDASETGPDPGFFTVSRTGGTVGALTLDYSVMGSATGGADYIALSGSVTIPDGSATERITVTPVDDALIEGATETVIVRLSPSAAYAINPASAAATVNIADNDFYWLAINDVAVIEGNSGTTGAVFTVSLSPASDQTVTVKFATSNDTAEAGIDYLATNGMLTFAPGDTTRTIVVPINGDVLNEIDETFVVNLSDAVAAMISDGQGTGLILNDDPQPALAINDVTVTEGNSGTTNAVFTVSLSAPSGQEVIVNFATADGTAHAETDYRATNGTLRFPPGTLIRTIEVQVAGDAFNEIDETFFVNLSDAANATIGDGQGVGSIINDDPLPTLTINDVTVSEPSQGATSAVFTVSLSSVSGQAVFVNFETADGTARAGSDYVATNGTLNFEAGTTTRTIAVQVMGDALDEPDESFFLNLSGATNAAIDDGQGTGGIISLPVLSIDDVTVIEGDSGTTNMVFTVNLSRFSDQTVTVNFATTNGTASAGSDYAATNGTLTFAPGDTTRVITVEVHGDALNEADETFLVQLSGAANAFVGDSSGEGRIANDDPLPRLSIDDATVTEGNSGTTNAIFTVSLSAVSGQTVTVNFTTVDETAEAGSDYVSTNGTLSFSPGTTTQTVVVPVYGEFFNEADETFFLDLSEPVHALVSNSRGIGSILNDDTLLTLFINDATVIEGSNGTNMVFTVNLSAASDQTVTVNYATEDASARAGLDYVAASGMLSFAPGVTRQTIQVEVIDDVLNESEEMFFVVLSEPVGAVIGDGQGAGRIVDNDPLPTLSINDVEVTEGDDGHTNAVFTVSLSEASGRTVEVNYATIGDTATADADYISTNGTLSFAAGTLTQTVIVVVNGDKFHESGETFFVLLSDATHAILGDSQGAGSIRDDDAIPSISIQDGVVTEGDGGTSDLVFAVSLSAPSGLTVIVNYATSNGTASAGSDYLSTNGTLIFVPGASTQFVTVKVNGDVLHEMDETLFIDLSDPINAVLADSRALGTIRNNEPELSFFVTDATVEEGNSGFKEMLFTVGLSSLSERTATVDFATADGMARAGLDYLPTNGSLTFPPGVTTQMIRVVILGDLLNESNETFFVNLSNAVNANLGDNQGIGTIMNDDPVVSISIRDAGRFEGNSGTAALEFPVQLSAVSGQTITVDYATANGSAVGSDFISTSGTLRFSPGQTQNVVVVQIRGDTSVETNETFFVNLSNPTNATLADNQAQGLILNDDGVPSIFIGDATVIEGDSGTTNAVFTVRLSAASSQAVTTSYATANGTATAGSDYVATNGLVTFPAGNTNQSITVRVLGDLANESSETFFVNLSGSTNGLINGGVGVGTIVDNDPLNLMVSTNLISVPEGGTNSFSVRLNSQPSSNVVVTVRFTSGDTDLSVSAGSSLVFNSANWNVDQPVILSAAEDNDTAEGQALFTVSAVGLGDRMVTARELDNDVQGLVVSSTQSFEPPPRIMGIELAGSNAIIRFTTVLSNGYRLERSDEIVGSPWTTAVDNIIGTGGIVQAADSRGAGQPRRFYRARLVTASGVSIAVPEGGTGNFTVRLAAQPTNNVTVTVARTSGSTSVTISGGSTLTFTPENWNVPQTVVVSASEDANTTDDDATVTISSPNLPNQTVNVTALDNDL